MQVTNQIQKFHNGMFNKMETDQGFNWQQQLDLLDTKLEHTSLRI